MAAPHVDITIEQGATYRQQFVYKDDAGDPIDLTGWSAAMMIRQQIEDEDPLISLTDSDGITLGGVAGTIDVVISAEETSELPIGDLVSQIELTTVGGDVIRLIDIKFNCTREVVR